MELIQGKKRIYQFLPEKHFNVSSFPSRMEDILPKNGLHTTSNPPPATPGRGPRERPGPAPDRCGLACACLEQIGRSSDIVHTGPGWQDSKQPDAVTDFVVTNSLEIRYIEMVLNCTTAWKVIVHKSGELAKPTDASKLGSGKISRVRQEIHINTDTPCNVLGRRFKRVVRRSCWPDETCHCRPR